MPHTKDEIETVRQWLIQKRDACLGAELDGEGAVMFSHAISMLYELQQNSEKH